MIILLLLPQINNKLLLFKKKKTIKSIINFDLLIFFFVFCFEHIFKSCVLFWSKKKKFQTRKRLKLLAIIFQKCNYNNNVKAYGLVVCVNIQNKYIEIHKKNSFSLKFIDRYIYAELFCCYIKSTHNIPKHEVDIITIKMLFVLSF